MKVLRNLLLVAGAMALGAGCGSTGPATYTPAAGSYFAAAGVSEMLPVAPVGLASAGGGLKGSGYLGNSITMVFPSDRESPNTVAADINYTFNFGRNLSLKTGLGYTDWVVEVDGDRGHLKMIPLKATVQYGESVSRDARWYGAVGIGYRINDLAGTSVTEAHDSVEFHLGTGLDLSISNMLGLCIEMNYTLGQVKMHSGTRVPVDAFGLQFNAVYKY